ncbi:TPA: RseA family anti-sigma factor [Neisseria subflava]|uniref:sigma-E factor negative regulatory protein n=1 Tax=Neisseria TaxID=482 RepID=UPI000D2FD7EC|nr:sigma-E factor negative regulatory protein [Neisseria subflava]
MNEKTNKALEYVSALMDGEALTDEMLDAVLADEEAMRAWHEYHIIGDCIRQGAAVKVADESMQSKAFTVPQAEAEGKQEKYAQREAANSGFFKFFAAVASVCAIAVTAWQFTPQTSRDTLPVAEKSITQPAQNIIPVSGTPSDKAASEPGETVVPNAAKDGKLENRPTVRTEQQHEQQTVVQ